MLEIARVYVFMCGFNRLMLGDGRLTWKRSTPLGIWEILQKLTCLPMGDGRSTQNHPSPSERSDILTLFPPLYGIRTTIPLRDVLVYELWVITSYYVELRNLKGSEGGKLKNIAGWHFFLRSFTVLPGNLTKLAETFDFLKNLRSKTSRYVLSRTVLNCWQIAEIWPNWKETLIMGRLSFERWKRIGEKFSLVTKEIWKPDYEFHAKLTA